MVDKDKLKSRLIDLIEIEKIYHDESLTLNKLAKKLFLSPHQLSEFLNNELKANFNSFINSYRIEEAKKILQSEEDVSILYTAFSVGFNSKSSFYEYFKKITGQSPQEYKENYSITQ